jgi:hypothetical protein
MVETSAYRIFVGEISEEGNLENEEMRGKFQVRDRS